MSWAKKTESKITLLYYVTVFAIIAGALWFGANSNTVAASSKDDKKSVKDKKSSVKSPRANAGAAADAPVDLNGDGRTDYVVVRNVGGGPNGQLNWFYNLNNSPDPTVEIAWGLAIDFPLSEDFDNDGKDDVAVWRPGVAGVAAFYILNSLTNTARVEAFGKTGDDPTVVADYNGDGTADLAVYRDGLATGEQSVWYYRTTPNGALTVIPWGITGDTPMPGDIDGNGSADITIQRAEGDNATFWTRLSNGVELPVISFGFPSDLVVPGDYDDDGKTDIAVNRINGSSLEWYWRRSADGVTVGPVPFGLENDVAVQGDYDGDGAVEPAVWRNGLFISRNSTDGAAKFFSLGSVGDLPTANFNAH